MELEKGGCVEKCPQVDDEVNSEGGRSHGEVVSVHKNKYRQRKSSCSRKIEFSLGYIEFERPLSHQRGASRGEFNNFFKV